MNSDAYIANFRSYIKFDGRVLGRRRKRENGTGQHRLNAGLGPKNQPLLRP